MKFLFVIGWLPALPLMAQVQQRRRLYSPKQHQGSTALELYTLLAFTS